MSKRRILRIAIGIAATVLAAWLLLCHYVVDQSLVCRACAATGSHTQWFLGVMPLGHPVFHDSGSIHGPWSLPLTPEHLQVAPSLATARLFRPDHVHEWLSIGASPYYAFGQRWGGCAIGAPRHRGPFAAAYLEDAEFRAFVEDLIVQGTYDRPTMAAYFAAEESSATATSEAYFLGTKVVAQFRQRAGSPTTR